jgi:hypothetical protein
MKFKNTIQALQKLGNNVVKEGRGILKKNNKSSGNLYRDFDYLVTTQKDSLTLEFEFGRADNYWQFVDEGVRGAGGFKGSGRARGQGSPFKYSSKMPPRQPLIKWIKSKGLKGRGAKGRFISNNSFAFLIQRSIFQRGLTRTQFFSKPFTEQLNKQIDNITEAFADDIESNLK